MSKTEDLVPIVNLEKQDIANNLKKSLFFFLTTTDKHVILLITIRGLPWKRK